MGIRSICVGCNIELGYTLLPFTYQLPQRLKEIVSNYELVLTEISRGELENLRRKNIGPLLVLLKLPEDVLVAMGVV